MQGGDLDAVLRQLLHHGTDLSLGEHEVAHDHRDIAVGLKREPRIREPVSA